MSERVLHEWKADGSIYRIIGDPPRMEWRLPVPGHDWKPAMLSLESGTLLEELAHLAVHAAELEAAVRRVIRENTYSFSDAQEGVVMGESEGRRPVWAVSHGEYSGYRILFLCESRELAEAEVAALKADEGCGYCDPFVEEMVLFSRPTVVMPVYRFFAEIRDATGVVKEWRSDSSEREETGYERLIPCSWRWVRAPMYKGLGGRLEVMGTDEKLCRKVYGEKRALLVADAVFRGQGRVEGVAGRRKGTER